MQSLDFTHHMVCATLRIDGAVWSIPSVRCGNAVKVVEILFYDTNMVKLVVEMPDPNVYSTRQAPHIPKLLFKLFPHLARHRCDNNNGYTFRRECRETEIPHLFEHLIIELQGAAQGVSVLKGETQWDWHIDPKGRFHVYVEYQNEMLVLAAIRVAERIINALDDKLLDDLDTDRYIRDLREIADMSKKLQSSFPVCVECGSTSAWMP